MPDGMNAKFRATLGSDTRGLNFRLLLQTRPTDKGRRVLSQLKEEIAAGKLDRAIDELQRESDKLFQAPLLGELLDAVVKARVDRIVNISREDARRVALSSLCLDPRHEYRVVRDAKGKELLHIRKEMALLRENPDVSTVCGQRRRAHWYRQGMRGDWLAAPAHPAPGSRCPPCEAGDFKPRELSEPPEPGMPRELRHVLSEHLRESLEDVLGDAAVDFEELEQVLFEVAVSMLLRDEDQLSCARILSRYRVLLRAAGEPLWVSMSDWLELVEHALQAAPAHEFGDDVLRVEIENRLERMVSDHLLRQGRRPPP